MEQIDKEHVKTFEVDGQTITLRQIIRETYDVVGFVPVTAYTCIAMAVECHGKMPEGIKLMASNAGWTTSERYD